VNFSTSHVPLQGAEGLSAMKSPEPAAYKQQPENRVDLMSAVKSSLAQMEEKKTPMLPPAVSPRNSTRRSNRKQRRVR
jgi:hypothetical protein